jgi:hypothetical protein
LIRTKNGVKERSKQPERGGERETLRLIYLLICFGPENIFQMEGFTGRVENSGGESVSGDVTCTFSM